MGFLSGCRHLVSVLLNDEGFEHYTPEETSSRLTGRGVAQILTAVPALTLLSCEPLIMQEAIASLYSLSVSRTFSLTHLQLRFANRETLFRVSSLFPSLTSLHLVEPNTDVGLALSQMTNLLSLQCTSFTWDIIEDTYFSALCRNLTSLTLKFPRNSIEPSHLLRIGECCQSLQSLTLAFYIRDSFIVPVTSPTRQPFFPQLKNLVLEGDISINLLASFLSSLKCLRQLSVLVSSFSIPSGEMDSLLLEVVKAGGLASLQYLQCYQWDVSLETILYMIDQTPALNTIWGLDLLLICQKSRETVESHIRKNNFNISLNDGIAPEQSRGLDWISEKINHREIRLSDFSRQTNLEEILVELNLL